MPQTVFLDFEASSLAKQSYPVEVAWVFETGEAETHLIRPAPGWDDWDDGAARIHGLSRERLTAEGEPHDAVARRMLATLQGQRLYASAPSWDGKWLSRLLRGAGLPRHALRLRDTDEAHRREIVRHLEARGVAPEARGGVTERIFAAGRCRIAEQGPVAHRALADAQRELAIWTAVGRLARDWPVGPTCTP